MQSFNFLLDDIDDQTFLPPNNIEKYLVGDDKVEIIIKEDPKKDIAICLKSNIVENAGIFRNYLNKIIWLIQNIPSDLNIYEKVIVDQTPIELDMKPEPCNVLKIVITIDNEKLIRPIDIKASKDSLKELFAKEFNIRGQVIENWFRKYSSNQCINILSTYFQTRAFSNSSALPFIVSLFEHIYSNNGTFKITYYANGMPEYKGIVLKNGKYHGQGTYYYNNNGEIYTGEWNNGIKTGVGKYFYKDGTYYEGLFENNQPHGRGKLYYSNGNISYDGEWVQGKKSGNGVENEPGGLRYQGGFYYGLRNGDGKVYDSSQRILYEGTWVNGLKNGVFTYYKANDSAIKKMTKYYKSNIEVNEEPKKKIKIQILSDDKESRNMTMSTPNEYIIERVPTKLPEVIIQEFNININEDDIHRLLNGKWLNGDIINLYMHKVYTRYKQNLLDETNNEQKHGRVHFFDSDLFTIFTRGNHVDIKKEDLNYQGLTSYVSKFTKETYSLFELYERLVFTVNIMNSHWCLAEINIDKKNNQKNSNTLKFILYDSSEDPGYAADHQNHPVLKIIEEFARKYSEYNCKSEFDELFNHIEYIIDSVPQQKNMNDCGVYVCYFIKNIALGIPICTLKNLNSGDMRKEIEMVIKGEKNPLSTNHVSRK